MLRGGFHFWQNEHSGKASLEGMLRRLGGIFGNYSRQLSMIHMWLFLRHAFNCMVACPSHSAGYFDTISICWSKTWSSLQKNYVKYSKTKCQCFSVITYHLKLAGPLWTFIFVLLWGSSELPTLCTDPAQCWFQHWPLSVRWALPWSFICSEPSKDTDPLPRGYHWLGARQSF